MAGITHLGVGLAAKRIAPKTPVLVLILAAYVIDFIWAVFFFAGIEHLPEPGVTTASPWSHGLFMAVLWSLLAGLITWLLGRSRRMSWIIGLLVFSHWVVDFISHPMTAVFPGDTGLPLLFAGSPMVGLGMWSTTWGVNIGEYGGLVLGVIIYGWTIMKLRQSQKTA